MERTAQRPTLTLWIAELALLLLYVGGSAFMAALLMLTLWNLPGG